MSKLSFETPIGAITLAEEGGKITGLYWGTVQNGEETPVLCEARDQLNAYLEGTRQDFDLPLAPQGTAFQQAVWQSMLKIPYGKTQSYGDIAKALKSGPRAVGGASSRNPIPIFIPCHRVLGTHGGLGGYSAKGGVGTKLRLLALEGVHVEARPG
ncbi:MAG: methylated-DNA--[protein]-cysteine S-methyltransferase [Alphaproteobacteria bacterium]|nr:methylated-DNA--[protein]-cysteine S-methyltransferase [Alphaproteobacteria bacterium]